MMLSEVGGEEADKVVARQDAKWEGERVFRLRNEIWRLVFGMGRGVSMSIVMARWSEM